MEGEYGLLPGDGPHKELFWLWLPCMLTLYILLAARLLNYAEVATWEELKLVIHRMFSGRWARETHSVSRMLMHANRFSTLASIVGLLFVIFYLVLKDVFVAHSECK